MEKNLSKYADEEADILRILSSLYTKQEWCMIVSCVIVDLWLEEVVSFAVRNKNKVKRYI